MLKKESKNPSSLPSRRQFIVGGTTCLLAAPAIHAAAKADKMLIVDCHAHIYGTNESKYPTIEKPYRPPQGKGTIDHLRKEMREHGVSYVTAIQTSTYYRWDNRFTADSAKRFKDWMVGVVTMNPDDAASPKKLTNYIANSNVRGMRSIPGEKGTFDDPGVAALWKTCQEQGIVVNVLTNPDKLEEVEAMLKSFPKLKVIIDHCFNISTADKEGKSLKAVVKLAANKNVHAKLTFLPTGSKMKYPCGDLHDACREVIKAYSPQRCVWGSDFPCELWCPQLTYGQHLDIFRKELQLEQKDQEWILGKTAQRLWLSRS